MASGWHRKRTTPADIERKKQYNSTAYKRARAAAKRTVDAGEGYCWRCGKHLPPGLPWHLGHNDYDRSIIEGPECVRCNLTTAGRQGAAIVNNTATRDLHDIRNW